LNIAPRWFVRLSHPHRAYNSTTKGRICKKFKVYAHIWNGCNSKHHSEVNWSKIKINRRHKVPDLLSRLVDEGETCWILGA